MKPSHSRAFFLLLSFSLLTACGGGGGGSTDSNNNDNDDDNRTPDVVYVSAVDGDDDFDGLSARSPKGTIAAAMDLAGDGTEVRVAEGTYTISEKIELKPGVSLLGGYARDFDTRDAAANDTVIKSNTGAFLSDDAGIENDTLVDGFVIESNASTGGKVDIDIAAGSPTIRNNVILGEDDGTDWIAVRISAGSPLLLNNTVTGVWTGFHVTGDAESAVIRGNTVNESAGRIPFGIYLDGGKDIIIDGNTLYGGDSSGTLPFAGIWVTGATSVNINNNTIDGGTSSGGTDSQTNGIYVAGGWVGIRNNVIYGGDGAELSAGVRVYGSVWMDNNTIDGGSGSVRSSGVSIHSPDHASLRNNILMATSGTADNYCIYDNNAAPDEVLNNGFFNCSTAPYYEAGGQCTNNEDFDDNNNTCPLSEMESLSDIGSVSGNVEPDPAFADADGADDDATTLADNDYHLTGSSPSNIVEGGLDLSEYLTADKDGKARTAAIAHTPDNGGEGWSIGAYELD